MRCSKSCYLCDLELVDLFGNWLSNRSIELVFSSLQVAPSQNFLILPTVQRRRGSDGIPFRTGLLSTRQETSLIMFMYMTLPSLIFSTGQDIGRFVPCKALKSDKKFSFAFSSSQNKSTKPNHWIFCLKRS